ncbi:hypothetical protein EDB19DRAFT_703724 [Suillus lakei]|nr:hypothetical protein EDB19DRAFT_703724 [Suillus lakei]
MYETPGVFQPSLPPEGKSDDFVVTFTVTIQNNPALSLEIRPPGHLNDLSARIAADDQTRERFRSLEPITVTPRLHGISAMGQARFLLHG